nr:cytochrome c peroxidase [Pedobacter sp. ASV19]
MYQNKPKRVILGLLLMTSLAIVLGLKRAPDQTALTHTITYFKENSSVFAASADRLKAAIVLLDGRAEQTEKAKLALKDCRLQYKRIAFFLDYFFESSAMIYNRPPKVEVEEPYMEYQEPSGLQVVEALLYAAQPVQHKEALLAQAELISSSADDLGTLTYQFEATDREILESIDLELVRVMALSISGYDAPELKSGIQEAHQSLVAIHEVLQPFLNNDKVSVSLLLNLDKAIQFTSANTVFDAFNRMVFLKDYAIPLQEALKKLRSLHKLLLYSKSALNPGARHLFDKSAIDIKKFPATKWKNTPEMTALGKSLFFEKTLSGNLKRSCASCHEPGKYFSDGLKTSLAFDGIEHVLRNAPTLYYVGYQYAQFWDGRAKSLQEQVIEVIRNPLEMNADTGCVVRNLQDKPEYVKSFKRVFGSYTPIRIDQVAAALSAYMQTLKPFNSAFDQYLSGNSGAMTKDQIKGFNLFMGKAQCGTCHFIPLFNGLIPPFYKRTEFEILGTPGNDDLKHPLTDKDQGRADFFSIEYYNGAFKTPGLRNAAMTAPYMHNGVFKDLEQVMDFYNKGGGAGVGLDLPYQTLPSKPLGLTPAEIKEIIAFIGALTDHK